MAKPSFQSSSALDSPPAIEAVGSGYRTLDRRLARNCVLVLLPLAWLWFCLINNLRLEWSTNPQYSYGWVVPFLCAGLLLRRWQFLPQTKTLNSQLSTATPWITLIFVGLALLYLPTRLIEEATPEWRPVQWLLGLEAVGLTLATIYLWKGWSCLRQLAFPICLFFVAIPWPTPIEAPAIQNLTRVSAGIVIEILGILGVPALQHGNVIEISTGVVGIDEACSGIRSLQTSLMISLFFGEFYRLNRNRRLLLVPISLLLAVAFNVCRMTLLTMIAAKNGVPAINRYHDPAGITISIACTFALWGVALLSKKPRPDLRQSSPLPAPRVISSSDLRPPVPISAFNFPNLRFFLVLWLVLVEVGVQLWYHSIESRIKPGPAWSLVFPDGNPTLREVPIPSATRDLLRYDDARQDVWQEPDGSQWQVFYAAWLPGRVAGYLAKRHTPEVCLPATGFTLRSGPELMPVTVHGLDLPVRCYTFAASAGIVYVFHCRWEAGVSPASYTAHESTRFNLLRGIWAGRGNHGQKVIEFVITGMTDPESAKQAFLTQLDKLIKVQNPTTAIAATPQPSL